MGTCSGAIFFSEKIFISTLIAISDLPVSDSAVSAESPGRLLLACFPPPFAWPDVASTNLTGKNTALQIVLVP